MMYLYYVILHVPYGNHRKMLGLTCFMDVCMYVLFKARVGVLYQI